MAEFITPDDYDATVHREILDSLVREDRNVIEICEDRAIDEMRCYMSQVYDCDSIFSACGEQRSQLVLMFALDISVYHIFCIHNPHNMSQIRIDRYERAVEWLKGIQKGQIRVLRLLLPKGKVPRRLIWCRAIRNNIISCKP